MTEPWWAGAPPNPGSPPQRPTAQQAAPWAPPPGVAPPGRQRPVHRPTVAGQVPGRSMPGQTTPPVMVGAPLNLQQRPAPASTGLGILIFLLVIATFAAGIWLFAPPAVAWATAIEPCLDGGGDWGCIVNADWRTAVLLPLVAMIAALCLARGAGIERRQGRTGFGFLYALLGFAALAAVWLVSAS